MTEMWHYQNNKHKISVDKYTYWSTRAKISKMQSSKSDDKWSWRNLWVIDNVYLPNTSLFICWRVSSSNRSAMTFDCTSFAALGKPSIWYYQPILNRWKLLQKINITYHTNSNCNKGLCWNSRGMLASHSWHLNWSIPGEMNEECISAYQLLHKFRKIPLESSKKGNIVFFPSVVLYGSCQTILTPER